ncbi:MAG TPA: hypothetical protein VMT94_09625 [Burkholderiales bacterium]|nr:hypothetical protein [Burkholderiales bacterium]
MEINLKNIVRAVKSRKNILNMPESPLRLIRKSAEFIPRERMGELPRELHGFYVLYRFSPAERKYENDKFDVLYVGMATAGRRGGIKGRLKSHAKSSRKGGLWTHFSVFVAWDNIRNEEIAELEGFFRHIYRHDSTANRLNIQKGFKKARAVREDDLRKWKNLGGAT